MGFIDFAGSTVVHSVGAWISLVGIWFIGARDNRFGEDGTVNYEDFKSYSLAYSTLGVFILWFGWWGFNGGSQLKYDLSVASIILNTNTAAAFGGLVAFFHAYSRDPQNLYAKLLGGVLGGLVAITASCNITSPLNAMVIGGVAGLIHNFAFDGLLKLKLDDPVGAIPVHGACGVWGTLCVSFFGKLERSRIDQFWIQLLGIGVVFFTVILLSIVFMWFLDRYIGIRITLKDKGIPAALG
jgi:Amt family ammonium transporter